MKYTLLQKIIKEPYFSKNDLELVGEKLYDYQLSEWVKAGHLVRIRNGLYLFKNRASLIVSEELSQKIYEPSYISLETALRYYNFIPEIVYSITSVTTKTNRRFNTKVGNYNYRHVKPALFFGYSIKNTDNGFYYLAEPEKAILDYIYLNSRVLETKDDFDEIRLNLEEFKSLINIEKYLSYMHAFGKKKVEKFARLCLQ